MSLWGLGLAGTVYSHMALIEPTLAAIGVCTIVENRTIIWIKPDRLSIIADRVVEAALWS
jgi:hypothetical protein